VIATLSESDSSAVVEEIPETSTQVIASTDDTDGITETVEVESSSLAIKDEPDDEIMETVEELGMYGTLWRQNPCSHFHHLFSGQIKWKN
jgi:hypothetical protein